MGEEGLDPGSAALETDGLAHFQRYNNNNNNNNNNNSNNNNNDNKKKKKNERISRAPFHVKHAQLRWTGANTKIQNTCI